jgi:hypothetical protein
VNVLNTGDPSHDLSEDLVRNYNITSIPNLAKSFPCVMFYFERNKQLLEISKRFQFKSFSKVNFFDMKFYFQ